MVVSRLQPSDTTLVELGPVLERGRLQLGRFPEASYVLRPGAFMAGAAAASPGIPGARS